MTSSTKIHLGFKNSHFASLILSFAVSFLTIFSLTYQIAIECDYSTYTYEVLGNIYRCNVKNSPNIMNQESALVTSTFGVHHSQKTNNEVIGFHAVAKHFQFFPKGLENIFKNIQSIFIHNCKLKEVHQADLQPFSNLIYLYLFGNLIQIIEPGLFEFNQNLEYISIGSNEIIHIDANVFDGLIKLWHLHLNVVACYDKFVCTFSDTQQFIKELKTKCKNPDFVEIEEKMKSLETEAGNLDYQDFNTKVVGTEKEFLASRFSTNLYLKNKFEKIKFMKASGTLQTQTSLKIKKTSIITQPCTQCCHIDQLLTLDMKIGNMSDDLSTIKPFQDVIDSQLNGISSMITDHSSKLNDIQMFQENITNKFKEFEGNVKEMIKDMKQDLATSRHKLAIDFDDKIRGIEKRLLKKFEDILEDKLRKIIDEQVGSIIDARGGLK